LKLRGYLTVAVAGIGLIVLDPVQRIVIAGLARLLPSKRIAILTWWERFLAHYMINTVRWVGGAHVEPPPTIPGHEGVLVLMNHQSLLDIPLVVAALRPHHPRIVTRERYARGKPLISHMVRLYQYPTVEGGATGREGLKKIRQSARESPVPFVIFPEGHRTVDGEIGPWQEGGLRMILGARKWTVYLMVADGYWRIRRLKDLLDSVSTIDGRAVVVGPFESPDKSGDMDAFLDEMRRQMQLALAGLRGSATAA
jgi:1-acyl-sn-glycerol-3-phosphate acyltransferase